MPEGISQNKIVTIDKSCGLPDFRFPDVPIDGIGIGSDPFANVQDEYQLYDDSVDDIPGQIGVPTNLQAQAIEDQKRIKKGTSTFIDVVVSFDGAPGAEYHEFRLSRVPEIQTEVEP